MRNIIADISRSFNTVKQKLNYLEFLYRNFNNTQIGINKKDIISPDVIISESLNIKKLISVDFKKRVCNN